MSYRPSLLIRLTALAAVALLPACGSTAAEEADLANLDSQITGNQTDPALTSALQDQILVDPALTQQSNRNAVRPPETPTQAQYPMLQQAGGATGAVGAPTAAGQRATLQRTSGEGTACGGTAPFDYNVAWANRLPSAFAVYPGGRVTDAAGNDQGDCRVRVVSFTTGDGWQRVLDWYHSRAVRAGYTSEHQLRGNDHVLGGGNAADGGAFYLIVTPLRSGGAEVALIANNGR